MDEHPKDSIDTIFSCVIPYINDGADRNSVSLVCRKWYELDCMTRRKQNETNTKQTQICWFPACFPACFPGCFPLFFLVSPLLTSTGGSSEISIELEDI
ncbi:hypothetical protein CTI12_AA069150 [Artemisia annua]|uniref:COI1 F-box domain-containing protein n=1 Tax=Artemisia annua TaxID=35608 RepID=A0A2U1Q6N9_ARTAN|nr:hypothetical protein CTI12_AA069150 [Artemisia annua]